MATTRSSRILALFVVSLIASFVLAVSAVPAYAALVVAQAVDDGAIITEPADTALIVAQAEDDAATITDPADGKTYDLGKSVTVKARAKYVRPEQFGLLNYPKNYIYLRVLKDGEPIGNLSKKDFSSLPGLFYTVEFSSFVPEAEGAYVIQVHHDYTYDADKNYVELDPEDFVADDSRTIIVQKNIKNAEITGLSDMVYTGQPLTPAPVVTIDGKTLDPDTDYDVSYASNTDAGAATVTVTGKGFYKDKATATFNIVAADIAQASMSGVVNATYTGSAIAQNATVIWKGRQLVEGADYDIAYDANTDAGTATITAIGKKNFAGTLSKTFTIDKASIRNASGPVLANKTYTGFAIVQDLNLKFGGKTLVLNTDYTVEYANNVNPGTATVTITGKGNFKDSMVRTFSIFEPSAAPSGDATILAPEDGSTYTPGSTITVRARANKFELPQYNGEDIKGVPNFIFARVFKDGNPYMTVRREYSRANTELNIPVDVEDPGVYEIQACWTTWTYVARLDNGGIAFDYVQPGFWDFEPSDSITVYVGVTPPVGSNVSSATVTGVAETKEYTGSSITQNPTVKLGGKTLQNGTDYYITYKSLTYSDDPANNVDIGIVEMTIHGKGDYTGSHVSTFVISPKKITANMITLTPTSLTYTGELQKPQVTVMNGSVLLHESVDYTLTNEGGIEPGNYEVSVKGKGNYSLDTVTKSYVINKWSIKNAVVTCEPATYTYDGQAKEPAVTAMLDGAVIPAEAYDVTYSKNTNAGTATATITAKADSYYTGSAHGTFTISPLSIAVDAISVAPIESVTYNRQAQTPTPQVMMGETQLSSPADFTLSYESNVNVGTAKVTITGAGNFKGSRTVTFAIDKKDVNDASVTIDPVPYQRYADGEPLTPPITVKDGNDELVVDEEFTVEYVDNIEVGTASATITGKGNYKGTRGAVEFQILERTEYAQTALTDAISAIEQEGTSQYLAEDKAAVEAAIAAAKQLLADETSSAESLEKALEELDAAVQGAKVNSAKKALSDAVDVVEKEGISQYSTVDRAVVQAALNAAKQLLADGAVTEEALKQALDSLNEAVDTAKTNLAAAEAAKANAEYERAKKEAQAMPSAEAVAKAILAQATDKDPAGSTFAPLMLNSVKQGKNKIVLKWSNVAGASDYVIYGNKCGKKDKIAKIATVKGTTYTHKKLKKGTYYKYVVVALRDTVIGQRAAAVSKMIHVATKGGKAGNAKKLTVKVKVGKKYKKIKAANVKPGKTAKLKVTVVPASKKLSVKKHVGVRYESSNAKVATVNAKGVIKGVAKGTCYVYAYAQNGAAAMIKVTIA